MKKSKYLIWGIISLLSLGGLLTGLFLSTQPASPEQNSATNSITNPVVKPVPEPDVKPVEKPVVKPTPKPPVVNYNFKNMISLQSQNKLLPPGSDGSNSYRIPSLVKTSGNNLLVFANQRKANAADPPSGETNIYQKSSKDLGQTWDAGRAIIHVEDNYNLDLTHGLRATAVDQAAVYNPNNHTTYLVADVWPAGSGLRTNDPFSSDPINIGDDQEQLGFTPDHKYWKFFNQDEPDKKYVLVPVKTDPTKQDKNDNWLQAYQLKDGSWSNTALTNLEATEVYVNNSFDSTTGNLHGDVYANVSNFEQFKISLSKKNSEDVGASKLVGNIWAGGNEDNDWSNYYVQSYPYIYLFKSTDSGVNWGLVGNITNQVGPWKNGFHGNNILVGPGRGLVLSHQKNPKLNGRMLFPFYEDFDLYGNVELEYAYTAYSDDEGLTWKVSNYIDDKNTYSNSEIDEWRYATEAQLVETNDGTIYAFVRSSNDPLMITKSVDGGLNYTNLNGGNPNVSTIQNGNISNTMAPGVVNAVVGKDNYIFYSQASTRRRANGVLFRFLNDNFNNGQLLWNYADHESDTNKNFAYSNLEILSIEPNQILIGSLYEVAGHYQWNNEHETEVSRNNNVGFIFSTFKYS